jgi:predicted nucleic acid-binding protein
MRYLVDTGVLLRAADRRDPVRSHIVAALRILRARNDELYVATQNLREFWNVSTRPSSARGGYGRSIERTSRWLDILRRMFNLAWELAPTHEIWKALVQQHRVVGTQVHDAHLVAVMTTYGITHLVTLNPTDFRRYTEVVAVTPKEIMATKQES